MINRTEEEIKEEIKVIFGNYPNDVVRTKSYYSFSLEDISIDFKKLHKLAIFFGSREIDVSSHQVSDGCETCGYGSYERTKFTITEENPKDWSTSLENN